MNSFKAHNAYRIALDGRYRDYVNQTYEHFLTLARGLSQAGEMLTDSDEISQLQDLCFLIREGILRITEEKSRDGQSSLFVEIFEIK